MGNTYSRLYAMVVFAVMGRSNALKPDFREELFKYITGIVRNKGQKLMAIGGVEDHIHILISYQPDMALSDLVRDIKANSNRFIFDEENVTDVFDVIAAGSIAGQRSGFNLFNNCPGGVCDELNTIRAIFAGGIQDQLLNLIDNQVQIGTDGGGNPVFETIRRYARYGEPLSFQRGRQVRFGFLFSF